MDDGLRIVALVAIVASTGMTFVPWIRLLPLMVIVLVSVFKSFDSFRREGAHVLFRSVIFLAGLALPPCAGYWLYNHQHYGIAIVLELGWMVLAWERNRGLAKTLSTMPPL
jgi:hypothetical protein